MTIGEQAHEASVAQGMKRRAFLASALASVIAGSARAVEYSAVVPSKPLDVAHELGSHPAFRIEWWYVTGWVRGPDGSECGIQVTFFRNRPGIAEDSPSHFAPAQLLFAHAAVADPRRGRLRHDQRSARAGFGLAEAALDTTDVHIGDWSLRREGDDYRAHIAARDFGMDLRFAPSQPPLLQGIGGYSQKGNDPRQASYYYSEPHLRVTGELAIDAAVFPVTGTAWLDHEWSSQVLAGGAVGWDWTGLNLDDGGALMAFRMRDSHGSTLWAGGSRRDANGVLTRYAPDDVRFVAQRTWHSPLTGADYPVSLRLEVGGDAYDLEPLMDDQELDARLSTGSVYWEGAVRAARDKHVVGRGYLELTGYGQPLRF
jgi:predicted secreted hydrolase